MKTKNITIRDVAKAAGVSAQTVSRVINDRPDVASETRERIEKIIAEIGYAPNVIARSLSRGHTHTLGVIGYGLEYYGSTAVLHGIERKANQMGYSLLLSLVDKVEPARVEKIVNDLLARRIDGIIWAVPGRLDQTEWLSEKLSHLSVPLVHINKAPAQDDLIVALNNRLGAQLATQHLLEQGYRRIGLIAGPELWWEAVEREAGWRDMSVANQVEHIDDLKVVGDWNAASGEVGLTALLAKNPDLDAVFVSNDQMALGALQSARLHGLRVPEDLGIVGFDDIPESAYFYPSLTTVRQNAFALGALAMDTLCRQMKAQKDDVLPIGGINWISPRLVVRKSSIRTPNSYS